jgi:hypothetical protein
MDPNRCLKALLGMPYILVWIQIRGSDSFFIDFKDAKNYVLVKICAKILFCKHYFSPNTFYENGRIRRLILTSD